MFCKPGKSIANPCEANVNPVDITTFATVRPPLRTIATESRNDPAAAVVNPVFTAN